MIEFALLILVALAILNLIATRKNHRLARKNMATIEERFTLMETKIDEATTEILALIGELRAAGVTPAAEAILQRMETKTNALADIVPGP